MLKGFLLKLTRVLFSGATLVFWLATLCSPAGGASGQAASPGASANPPASSQRLLERCWSSQELQGTPENRQSHQDLSATRRDPPARVVPQTLLPPLEPALQGSIRSVEPSQNQKVIALTFDLCETTGELSGYDAEIVNYLRTHQVKATFYAGGKWMRSHPVRTQQLMTDPLFELGNHSWSHANFRKLTASQMEQQILWTQAQYELLREDLHRKPCRQEAGTDELQRAPRTPLTLRFPYGACTPLALQVAARCGLGREILLWLEQQSRTSASNLWTTVSSFNLRAHAFYLSCGYVEIARLANLVRIGYDEVLLRKDLGSWEDRLTP